MTPVAPTPIAAAAPGIRDRGLLAVIVAALFLNFVGLSWGLPPHEARSWELDGIRPVEPLVVAKRLFVDQWWNSGFYRKYPLGHYFILVGATTPYVGYLWLTGGLREPTDTYPYGLQDPDTALTALALITRAVSALMGVGIVALLYLTVRPLAGRLAALFSALAVACSPAFIYYAHTSNVDTPSLFWCALGLFAFGRIVQGRAGTGQYVLLGVATGMAAATKEQTVGLFLLVPLSLLVMHVQRDLLPGGAAGGVRRALRDRRLLGGFAASVVTFVIATHLVFNWEGNLLRFRWRLLGIHPKWGADHSYGQPEVDGLLDALAQAAVHTAEIMNPVLFGAALVGLFALPRANGWARHFLVPLISYLAFAIALFAFFRARFVMELALVLAVFAGPVLAGLWRAAARRHPALVAPLLAVWLYSFAYGFDVNALMLNDTRYAAEAWLERVAPGATVATYGHVVYLPRPPAHLHVEALDFTVEDLERLPERSPDYVVLSGRYRDVPPGSREAELVDRLLAGELGYRLTRTFVREPVLSPPLIAGLSPEIVILARPSEAPGGRSPRTAASP